MGEFGHSTVCLQRLRESRGVWGRAASGVQGQSPSDGFGRPNDETEFA